MTEHDTPDVQLDLADGQAMQEVKKRYPWTPERAARGREIHTERWRIINKLTETYTFMQNPSMAELAHLIHILAITTKHPVLAEAVQLHKDKPHSILPSLRLAYSVYDDLDLPSYGYMLISFAAEFGGVYSATLQRCLERARDQQAGIC